MTSENVEAVERLVCQARKLELIDSWVVSDDHLVLSRGAVTYRIELRDAVRFLRSLIRNTGGTGRRAA